VLAGLLKNIDSAHVAQKCGEAADVAAIAAEVSK
jgi:hypothetical protein